MWPFRKRNSLKSRVAELEEKIKKLEEVVFKKKILRAGKWDIKR